MSERDGPSDRWVKPGRAVTVIALPLAGLLWFGMVSLEASSHTAGELLNGIEAIAALACGFVLWLMLAGMLVLTAADGRFTRWTGLAAPVVFVLSAIGASRALNLHGHGAGWAMVLVAVLPLVVALYAFRPRLLIAAAIMVLTVPVIVLDATDAIPRRERGQRIAGEVRAREGRDRSGYPAPGPRVVEAFSKLGPDSRMSDYLRFVRGGLAGPAREGIRLVKSRQADTVALLNEGNMLSLAGLWDFDIAATPEVCAAYAAALDRQASKIDPTAHSYYSGLDLIDLERQRPNLRWLVGEGCDLKAPLGRLEKTLRSIADIPFVTGFADEVAALRAK